MSATRQDYTPLRTTQIGRDHQKQWFANFRRGVLEENQPYVVAGAVTPHEILDVLGIPVVSDVWYSSIISAKQMAPHYFDVMDRLGYHEGLPRYTSLPLACTLDNDPASAPYGGLPKPLFVLERLRGDYAQRITEKWAKAFGVPHYVIDAPSSTRLDLRWFERGMHDWEDLYETHRLDFQVEQLESLIRFAETLSGRTFDEAEFTRQMHRINRAGELVAEVRELLAAAPRSVVPLPEQLATVMTATWHRGSQWSVDFLTQYRDEVTQRVAQGDAFCPDERVRLLWLNNGLWHNTGFYRKFEAKYGATFVWSMYSDFLSDGYRKYFSGDPMRALAARHISMNEQLHLPGWMSEWIVEQAKRWGVHGAVMLVPKNDRLSAFGARHTARMLEAAGLPVVELEANMVDSRQWDDAAMTQRVEQFIETRALSIPFK